jgi:hypothetical protein
MSVSQTNGSMPTAAEVASTKRRWRYALSTDSESDHVIIPGRDHMTLVSDIALPGDPGRVVMIDFLRSHLSNP